PDSNKDRDWMEQLLRYANEPNLRQRLKDLINRYELDFLFEDNKAKKNFINMAINTRNYFTHYDSSIKHLKASGPELIYTTRLLSAILYACITAKLPIDRSKSRRIIQEMMERL
ncbi:MAG: HEPN domain-containing protein, partial [Allomuricauda sp.]